MPLYVYECPVCGRCSEEIIKLENRDNPVYTPTCNHASDDLDVDVTMVRKTINTKTSFILKGKGWYRTDYKNKK